VTLSITKQDDVLTPLLPAIFDFKYQAQFDSLFSIDA